MPLRSIGGVSPYEKLLGEKPIMMNRRCLDAFCYAFTLKRDRHKFKPRADSWVFIRYPMGQKGYKLYNLAIKVVFVSRDVQFHEKFFPYQHLRASYTSPFTQFFFTPQISIILIISHLSCLCHSLKASPPLQLLKIIQSFLNSIHLLTM